MIDQEKYLVGEIMLDRVTNQTLIHSNNTRKFLLPCLKEYGETLSNKLQNVFKVAAGLGDFIITKRYFKIPERHIFILIDSTVAIPYFLDFIRYVREQEYYEDDYVYGNIQDTPYHMVILEFPKVYWDAFETFKGGKYSEMFSQETICKYFNTKDNSDATKILIKDHEYKIKFVEELNRKFNATLTPSEYQGELALPPKEDEENFNPHLK